MAKEVLKGAAKSWTVRFGLALIVLTEVLEYMPEFEGVIPTDTYGAIIKGIGLAVILLRVITTVPLAER